VTLTDAHGERRYFRLQDEVILACTPLDCASDSNRDTRQRDACDLSTELEYLSLDSRRLLRRVEKLEPVLGEYLLNLERKIQAISAYLLDRETATVDSATRCTVLLSACGIGFDSCQPLATGDTVELRLILLPERTGLRLYGRVIHCVPPSATKPLPTVGIEFIDITEQDQEILIAHLLRVERRQRRQPPSPD
jgi:hypothetical protein